MTISLEKIFYTEKKSNDRYSCTHISSGVRVGAKLRRWVRVRIT